MIMHNIKALGQKLVIQKIAKILLGVVALIAGANIWIPLDPVPITFHTVIVMAIGLTYSKEEGLMTLGAYLSLGAIGLPVFLGFNSTLAYMMGPTGGYLIGFALSVYVMAYLKENFDISMLLNCTIGHMIIYTLGIIWLSKFIGIEAAIYKGFIIYIPTGILKIAALLTIMGFINKQRH